MSSRYLKSYWVNQISLGELDRKRLAFFVGEELRYYNTLVTSFAGPIRSMPETFVKTGALDDLLAVIAERAEEPRTLRVNRLPEAYKPFQGVLFDGNRLILDDRMTMIANTLATPATLAPEVRRVMAMSILKEMRRQSRALNESAATDTGAMPTIVEALSEIDRSNKRHVQLPRAAIKVKEASKDELTLKLPYFSAEFVVPKPNASWNYAYVRVNPDGSTSLDLAHEEAAYVLRKIDRAPGKGPRR